MHKSSYRTVNFTLPVEDMPIDISSIFENEKPAGKHGFLQANGPHFTFEDGTPGRFWGTNFNSGACFPSHEYSDIVAKRLAKVGLNIVRFHQLDGDWSTPNIFQFTKGKNLKNTRSLDPQSLDALDYLIYALKQNGIYVYLDMLTYRRWRTGDGVANAKHLRDNGRPQSNFNPRMIELQKEYASQLWNHVNPYTQLAYKDDPVIVLTEITNENEIFRHPTELVEPYRTELEEMYCQWRSQKGLPELPRPIDMNNNQEKECVEFKIELQKKYFDDMYTYMRSIGVKCPITGTNWRQGGLALLLSEDTMPFMDSHAYPSHVPPAGHSWQPYEKHIKNMPMYDSHPSWIDIMCGQRIYNKPFFVSEWDNQWPNEFRAHGPLWLAAVCCLQGWDGTAIHTYRYDCRPNINMIAAKITGEALSNIPYRSGIYDCFNDPCRFGLFYHAALMLRRGDMKESPAQNIVRIPGPMLSDALHAPQPKDDTAEFIRLPVLEGIAEREKIVFAQPNVTLPQDAVLLDTAQSTLPENVEMTVSDTGEFKRYYKKQVITIDTPRTKIASGLLQEFGEVTLQGLKIKCHNQFAVIALSSLNDLPLDKTDSILLTAMGNVDNTDAQYNENHTMLFDKGHGPIEAEVIVADFEMATDVANFRVDAINANGMQVGQSLAEVKDGKLRFTIGGEFASIYYLIQKI